MKITNHVAMLKIERPGAPMYPTLLFDQTELILVDACLPSQFEMLAEAIHQAGFHPADLTRVILTHQDLDHIGCVNEIRSAAPKVRFLAHKLEAPYIDGRQTPIKLHEQDLRTRGCLGEEREAYLQKKEAYDMRRISIDLPLDGGEILPICGNIEILHTPGHTPGHICLYIHDGEILICGDALNAKDGVLTGPNPIYTQNMEQALDSLRPLQNRSIKQIISYHGGLITENIQQALANILNAS